MTPWKVRYSIGWSSVWSASRRFPARSGGPCGTANESSTPSCSSRTSQWSRVAWCRCTTYRGFAGAFRTVPFGSGVLLKSRFRWYSVKLTAYALSGEGPMSSFADLADTFLKEEFAESPVQASSLGLTAYDEKLDDLSADAFRRHEERSASWLARFPHLPDDSLSPPERIHPAFASSILRGRELTAARRNWQRQPATYLNPGLQGVFSLFLHKLRPEKDLADAARARLAEVPRALRQGMDNLDFTIVPRIYVDRAIGQAKAAAKYARELVPQEVTDRSKREQLAATGAEAGDAFDAFAEFLVEKKEKATGTYAIGESLYTSLLQEKELLPYDARSLRERGREQYDLLAAELRRLSQEIAGTDDWAGLLEKLNKVHAPTPELMRAEYEEWTEKARSFLRDTGLVTLPQGERCTFEP